jgi:conflict system STAND superfamily ATPase/pentapeptide repeat protein
MAQSGWPENSDFGTSNDIRRAHVALMKRCLKATKNPPTRSEIVGFVNRVAEAGCRLEAEAERADAQNTLDYWNAALISMEKEEGAPNAETELALFVRRTDVREHDGENPFAKIGLFGKENRALISARADEIGEIVALVREKPIVFVTRAAGTGRSALVTRGVVPRIEASPVTPRKAFILSSPSPDPLAGLASMVGAAQDFARELRRKPAKLRDRIGEASGGGKALIVVDNVEDMFTSGVDKPSQNAFAEAIAEAVAAPDIARAILIVSEEYAQTASGLKAFRAEDVARSSVPPLSATDVRHLVEALAKDAGLLVEIAVVEDLALALQGEKSAFAMAHFMLLHLWTLGRGSAVGWAEYARLGRPDQALGQIAELTFESLSPRAQQAAERIFLALAKPEGDWTASSRPVKRAELLAADSDASDAAGPDATDAASATKEALGAFEDAGLLIDSVSSGVAGSAVEMVADRLMFNWGRLDSWIRAERNKDEQLARLRSMALLWEKSAQKEGYLLNEEESIREARQYLKSEPSDSVLAKFVDVSDKFLSERRRVELWRAWMLAITASCLAVVIAGVCVFLGYQLIYSRLMRESAQSQINKDLGQLRAEMSKAGKYCNIKPEEYRRIYTTYLYDRIKKVDSKVVNSIIADIDEYLAYAKPNVNFSLSNIGFIDEDSLIDILQAKFTTSCTLFIRVDLSSDRSRGVARDFIDSSFNKSIFIDTKFSSSNLAESLFEKSELFSTSFAGANLTNADFRDTVFRDVDFSQAILNGATFRNVSMDDKTIESLRSTAWWRATGWTEKQVDDLTAEHKDQTNEVNNLTQVRKDGINDLIKMGKTENSGPALVEVINAYNLALGAIQAAKTAQTAELRRNIAFFLNYWAWELAINGVYLVPDDEAAVNDLLSTDYCDRMSISSKSMTSSAVAARTALCLISDQVDSLWTGTADTFAYALLQYSQTVSEQRKPVLLRAAIDYWTKQPLRPKEDNDALFRLAIAECAAGSEGNSKDHMIEAVTNEYVPSHEIVLLKKYFNMKRYIEIKNELEGIAPRPDSPHPSCPP